MIHEVTRSGTALPQRRELRLGKPAPPLEGQEGWERRPPGTRASRPHTLPLPAAQFPWNVAPVNRAAGNPMARPKQSSGAVAGLPGCWRWERPCQSCAGGTPALPGGLHSVTSSQQEQDAFTDGSGGENASRRWLARPACPGSTGPSRACPPSGRPRPSGRLSGTPRPAPKRSPSR